MSVFISIVLLWVSVVLRYPCFQSIVYVSVPVCLCVCVDYHIPRDKIF